jgi:hypothetical protein
MEFCTTVRGVWPLSPFLKRPYDDSIFFLQWFSFCETLKIIKEGLKIRKMMCLVDSAGMLEGSWNIKLLGTHLGWCFRISLPLPWIALALLFYPPYLPLFCSYLFVISIYSLFSFLLYFFGLHVHSPRVPPVHTQPLRPFSEILTQRAPGCTLLLAIVTFGPEWCITLHILHLLDHRG